MRISTWLQSRQCLWAASRLGVVAICFFSVGGLLARHEKAEAYTWTSLQYYLRTQDNHYGYRTTSFDFASWQPAQFPQTGAVVAIQRIGLSARISSASYTYYGWNMMFEKSWIGAPFDQQIDRGSPGYEPGFAMDWNNGWVTRNQYSWGDAWHTGGTAPDDPIFVYAFTCHLSTYCGSWAIAITQGTEISAALGYYATSASEKVHEY